MGNQHHQYQQHFNCLLRRSHQHHQQLVVIIANSLRLNNSQALKFLIISLLAITLYSLLLVQPIQATLNTTNQDDPSSFISVDRLPNDDDVIESGGFIFDRHLSDELDGLIPSFPLSSSDNHKQDSGDTSGKSPCPHGFFACLNGECLSPRWHCDGHYDCDDFSDELNCTKIETNPSSTAINRQSSSQSLTTHAPLPPQIQEEFARLKFNSSIEPLLLFSTGVSIRGFWMRTRIYFDVHVIDYMQTQQQQESSNILSTFFDLLLLDRPSSSSSSQSQKSKDKDPPKSKNTIVGLDMDPDSKEVYWVELGKDPGIYSAIIDNEQFERPRRQFNSKKTLVNSGLLSPEDIALDLIGKNVYVTDAGLPAIVVCSVKKIFCKKIIDDNLHKPRAIIVDPSTGWLTYTDWGDNPGIFLATMDGKRRETLVNTDVVWPNGLAIDHQSNQLYWADAHLSKIERINLITRKRHEVIRETSANPFSLSMFENRIYWSDWSGSDIRTCDKISGNSTTAVLRSDSIYGIHIYHPNIYSDLGQQKNPCWEKKCTQLCLVAPAKETTSFADRKVGSIIGKCECSDHQTSSFGEWDDHTACHDTTYEFLLMNINNYIAQMFPEKIGLNTIETIIYSKDHTIHDVAPDWNHLRLFFYDSFKQEIYIANLKTGKPKIEQFIETKQLVRGLVYDFSSDNLYWLDTDQGTLTMCSVKSKFQKVIKRDLDRPISLVLDSKNRVFYMAMLGHTPHIMRSDIFGNEHSDLIIVRNDIGLPVSLHLDGKNQRLYWADARRETIESVDLDIKSQSSGVMLNSRIEHRRKVGTILAFTVFQGNFIWTVKNGDYLFMSKISDSYSSKVSFKLPQNPSNKAISSDNMRLIAVNPMEDAHDDYIYCQKRHCTHGCVLDANHTAVCVYPDDEHSLPLTNKPLNENQSIICAGNHCNSGLVVVATTNTQANSNSNNANTNVDADFGGSVTTAATASALAASVAAAGPNSEPPNGNLEFDDRPKASNRMVWLIVLLLLLSITGLITLVSLLILCKQGRLPSQVSGLSVSFIPHSHDKDGAMLLLDNDLA